MKTLIINAPRTGSTSLFNKLVRERNVKGYFNPWDGSDSSNPSPNEIVWSLESFVVKNGILYTPTTHNAELLPQFFFQQQQVNWHKTLAAKFDEVILLSRKDSVAHIESYAHMLLHNTPDQWEKARLGEKPAYSSTKQYIYDPDKITKDCRDRAVRDIMHYETMLQMLSKQLSIPMSYYEDYFDPNGKDRYRKNKEDRLI